MKIPLLLFSFALTSITPLAQGTITFFNNNIINAQGQTYRAGIFQDNNPLLAGDWKGDSTIGAGPGFSVGLFLPGSSAPLNYVNGSSAVTTLRSTTAREVFATSGDVVVTGVSPGATATLVVRVWQNRFPTWQEALQNAQWGDQYGEQTFTSKPLGGTNPNPPPPSFFTPDMAPFTGFEMETIPEPSTLVLGALGIGALLLRRRK